ncbi:hypothetical protein Q4E93_00460 [Flavitalea sp. BT771]|uniref:hypothetical protein n=1 Tax=Flavitalea sp. BT771 TaxID=3063329 RepID=UPI0026E2A6E8|nr:hypothetical protein [Flavitalea sp. BT771]MDO6429035.1 hypothetical protein [Flavitalea sp. BT771]MDV6218837.1 hypothetical protein [Flavitalea sp. BT771]
MKQISFLLLILMAGFQSKAKVWRINNNAGVVADYTSFYDACTSTAVAAGDTLYVEPSTTDYATNSFTLSKRLVVIGPGYFLDPANTTTPGNAGLQVAKIDSRIAWFRVGAAAAGSGFLGVTLQGIYLTSTNNISFERDLFTGGLYYETGTEDNISIRKCFFNGQNISAANTVTATNFVCENSIFYNNGYISLPNLAGSGNIVRNNSNINGANGWVLHNAYFVNNIIGCYSQSDLTSCTIKNNLFQVAQTLPGTATANLVSQDMTTIYVGGATGSLDSRVVLKSGSPAIAAGLTVGTVSSPDCGAYGATDPYRLSGIPNIPSIYSLTVPTSIPSGTATVNITFSSKNNN